MKNIGTTSRPSQVRTRFLYATIAPNNVIELRDQQSMSAIVGLEPDEDEILALAIQLIEGVQTIRERRRVREELTMAGD